MQHTSVAFFLQRAIFSNKKFQKTTTKTWLKKTEPNGHKKPHFLKSPDSAGKQSAGVHGKWSDVPCERAGRCGQPPRCRGLGTGACRRSHRPGFENSGFCVKPGGVGCLLTVPGGGVTGLFHFPFHFLPPGGGGHFDHSNGLKSIWSMDFGQKKPKIFRRLWHFGAVWPLSAIAG